MVSFVYTKRNILSIFTIGLLSFLCTFGVFHEASAQGSMICDAKIQLSLPSSCSQTIDPELFLSTTVPDSLRDKYWLEIRNSDNVVIDTGFILSAGEHDSCMTATIDTAWVNAVGEYTVTVYFDEDGVCSGSLDKDNSCWSELLVEFKITPQFEFGLICGEGNDSCVFSCTYADSIFNDTAFTAKLNLNPSFEGIQDSFPCLPIESNIQWRDEMVGDICDRLVVKRTWFTNSTVTNAHQSNESVQVLGVQEFIINSNMISEVEAPLNKIEVSCGIDTDPESIYNYLISKNNPLTPDSAAKSVFPNIVDTLISGSGTAMPFLVHLDTINIPLRPGVKSGGSASNVTCNLAVSYSDDSKIPICGNAYKFIRNWTVIDWCTGTAANFTQLIDATGGGDITMSMANDTFQLSTDPWFCSANLTTGLPFVESACSDEFTFSIISAELGINSSFASGEDNMNIPNIPPGVHELQITIRDECGNNVSDTIFVNVSDAISPVAVAKQHVVATLLSSGDDKCAAKIRANSVDNNSYDACSDDNVKLEVKRYDAHDSTYAGFVELTVDDLTDTDSRGIEYGTVKVALRVWDDGNGDGVAGTDGDNFNIAWTNVLIEDKNTDIFAECGNTSIMVDCEDSLTGLIAENQPTARRAGCKNETVPVTSRLKGDGRDDVCGTGNVQVEYLAGDKIICVKTFTFSDMDSIQIDSSVFPADKLDASCDDTSFGDIDFSDVDLGCNQIGVSVEEESFEFESGFSCIKILRHFTIIDWCEHDANAATSYVYQNGVNVGFKKVDGQDVRNGIWKRTQVVKISSDVSPTLTGCEDASFSASGDNCYALVSLSNSATMSTLGNLCPTGMLKWAVSIDLDGDGVYETAGTVSGTENVTASFEDPIKVGIYKVRWQVSSVCGSPQVCITNLTVADDKAPTPICINTLSTAVMEQGQNITVWASDFIASEPNDPCSNTVSYSFSSSDPNDTHKTITCSDINNGVSEIFEFRIYAHDESGNTAFCTALIKVDDNQDVCPDINTGNSLITGSIATPKGDMVESAKVKVSSNSTNSIFEKLTNVEGKYAFDQVPSQYSYTLNSDKNDDFSNGVSTLDLILIQKHILGLRSFTSAYEVLAADINNDRNISALDLVELRRLILGITGEFSNNTSWRFVDAKQTFEDELSPWPFIESMDIQSIKGEKYGMNFIGVKIGDLNGNVHANSLITGRTNDKEYVSIQAEDVKLTAGQVYEVSMDAQHLQKLYGVQLALDFIGAQLIDVSSHSLTLNQGDYHITPSSLILGYADLDGFDLDGEIITMKIRANHNGLLSEMVRLSSQTNSELYANTSLDIKNIQLEFTSPHSETTSTVFELYQNEPNPFGNSTTVRFLLGEDGNASLNVFDLTGRMVHEVSGSYRKGMNQIVIDKSQLASSGVYYYQLSHNGNIATRKMILTY